MSSNNKEESNRRKKQKINNKINKIKQKKIIAINKYYNQ